MATYKSNGRLRAEEFYKQSQAATNRASQQAYGGGGFLDQFHWRNLFNVQDPQAQLEYERAAENETYALAQQRAQQEQGMARDEQARALSDVMVARGMDPRAIPGIGSALGGSQGAEVVNSLYANPAVSPDARALQAQGQQEAANQGVLDQAKLAATQALTNQRNARTSQIQQAAQAEAMGDPNPYGSGINFDQFQGLKGKQLQYQSGIDASQFVMDVVGSMTTDQIAASAEVKSRLASTMYGLYKPLQAMTEDKASVLRAEDRKAIDEFLGSPDKFIGGLTTRDAATVEKFRYIQNAMQRNMDSMQTGLDERTRGLLQESAPPDPNMYNFAPPKGATIRDPVGGGFTAKPIPAGEGSGGLAELGKKAWDFYSDPQGLNDGR